MHIQEIGVSPDTAIMQIANTLGISRMALPFSGQQEQPQQQEQSMDIGAKVSEEKKPEEKYQQEKSEPILTYNPEDGEKTSATKLFGRADLTFEQKRAYISLMAKAAKKDEYLSQHIHGKWPSYDNTPEVIKALDGVVQEIHKSYKSQKTKTGVKKTQAAAAEQTGKYISAWKHTEGKYRTTERQDIANHVTEYVDQHPRHILAKNNKKTAGGRYSYPNTPEIRQALDEVISIGGYLPGKGRRHSTATKTAIRTKEIEIAGINPPDSLREYDSVLNILDGSNVRSTQRPRVASEIFRLVKQGDSRFADYSRRQGRGYGYNTQDQEFLANLASFCIKHGYVKEVSERISSKKKTNKIRYDPGLGEKPLLAKILRVHNLDKNEIKRGLVDLAKRDEFWGQHLDTSGRIRIDNTPGVIERLSKYVTERGHDIYEPIPKQPKEQKSPKQTKKKGIKPGTLTLNRIVASLIPDASNQKIRGTVAQVSMLMHKGPNQDTILADSFDNMGQYYSLKQGADPEAARQAVKSIIEKDAASEEAAKIRSPEQLLFKITPPSDPGPGSVKQPEEDKESAEPKEQSQTFSLEQIMDKTGIRDEEFIAQNRYLLGKPTVVDGTLRYGVEGIEQLKQAWDKKKEG